MLQLVELGVAFIFVDVSVHVPNSGLMVAAAGVIAALAVTANGPLGIFRICRPWLHLTMVISVAAVVAVAPIIPTLRPDIEGIIVIEFGAIGLIRLATLTDMRPSSRSRRTSTQRRHDRTVIDTTAALTPERAAPNPASAPSDSGVGTAVPTTVTASTSSPPATSSTSSAGAGGADRPMGRSGRRGGSVSGRRAVARHRPEAEAHVKRAIREAGRLTGQVTSPGDRNRPGQPGERPGTEAGAEAGTEAAPTTQLPDEPGLTRRVPRRPGPAESDVDGRGEHRRGLLPRSHRPRLGVYSWAAGESADGVIGAGRRDPPSVGRGHRPEQGVRGPENKSVLNFYFALRAH